MLSRLSISNKGLLLVSLPLVFELVFVITLSFFQREAEKVAIHERKLARLEAQVNGVANLISRCATLVATSLTSKDYGEERFDAGAKVDELCSDLDKRLREMDSTMADFPSLLADYRAYRKAIDDAQNAAAGLKSFNQLDSISRVSETFTARRAFNQMNEEFERFRGAVEKEQEKDPQIESSSRLLVDVCLFSGIAFNVLLTVVLSLFFSRTITNRLFAISDNAKRLASQLPLRPPLTGVDEIARLDRVFHQMADSLEEAAQRERALVDEAVDVILSLDSDLRITRVNNAGINLWSKSRDIIGVRIADFLDPDDTEAMIAALQGLRKSENQFSVFQNKVITADDKTIYVLWSVRWSKHNGSYFCIGRDVTKAMELENLKRDFLSMVSHDLRTPISAVALFVQLLLNGVYGKIAPAGVQNAERVQNNLGRLIDMINNLLDVERMERGSITLSLAPVSLSNIVSDAVDLVVDVARLKKISIDFDEQTDLIVSADHDRVVQVVQNLLSNAIKFSANDTTVNVRVVEERGWAKVEVKDQGPGIAGDHIESIFDRYRQVNKNDAKGFGLGLAICKNIIEEHGGEVGVVSQPGKGSTFWFKLAVITNFPDRVCNEDVDATLAS